MITTLLFEFFHIKAEAFLNRFLMDYYWQRFEFAKSRGKINLDLLGIIRDAAANKILVIVKITKEDVI